MKVIVTNSMVEHFNSKELYKKVIELFDEYFLNIFVIQGIAEKSLSHEMLNREECFQRNVSNPTYQSVIQRDKIINKINNFEKKIDYIKTQFTKDEEIIYQESIIERNTDKEIMLKICKSDHKYYELKKNCYLKIALCFGLIQLKANNFIENEAFITQMT